AWPNSPRVVVELINEYISNDFYSRMQQLINDIRSAGYTNPILVNKWNQPLTVINDPLGNTYQGYHYYFNSWSPSGAISQVKNALSKGIKLINTEVGADYRESTYFTTTTVEELGTILNQCASLGVGNCVWVNENLNNWSNYQSLSLSMPAVLSPLMSTLEPTPTSAPTPNPEQKSTSNWIMDDFESNTLSNWSGKTITRGEVVKTARYDSYSGSYHAVFDTTGSTQTYENAFLTKNVDTSIANASGQFYFSDYRVEVS
ncbi:MAG: hypothetical protein QG670_545, partial [Thermoproteota archaeon]|nr:hypothetical protein [Thermoproteota archaeon]